MRHEVLFLNPNRVYVKVGDTWYDTHRELNPEIGQSFLNGKVSEVLPYDEFRALFPDVKDEMYSQVSDKTISTGFLRRTVGTEVKYAVNPVAPTLAAYTDNTPSANVKN